MLSAADVWECVRANGIAAAAEALDLAIEPQLQGGGMVDWTRVAELAVALRCGANALLGKLVLRRLSRIPAWLKDVLLLCRLEDYDDVHDNKDMVSWRLASPNRGRLYRLGQHDYYHRGENRDHTSSRDVFFAMAHKHFGHDDLSWSVRLSTAGKLVLRLWGTPTDTRKIMTLQVSTGCEGRVVLTTGKTNNEWTLASGADGNAVLMVVDASGSRRVLQLNAALSRDVNSYFVSAEVMPSASTRSGVGVPVWELSYSEQRPASVEASQLLRQYLTPPITAVGAKACYHLLPRLDPNDENLHVVTDALGEYYSQSTNSSIAMRQALDLLSMAQMLASDRRDFASVRRIASVRGRCFATLSTLMRGTSEEGVALRNATHDLETAADDECFLIDSPLREPSATLVLDSPRSTVSSLIALATKDPKAAQFVFDEWVCPRQLASGRHRGSTARVLRLGLELVRSTNTRARRLIVESLRITPLMRKLLLLKHGVRVAVFTQIKGRSLHLCLGKPTSDDTQSNGVVVSATTEETMFQWVMQLEESGRVVLKPDQFMERRLGIQQREVESTARLDAMNKAVVVSCESNVESQRIELVVAPDAHRMYLLLESDDDDKVRRGGDHGTGRTWLAIHRRDECPSSQDEMPKSTPLVVCASVHVPSLNGDNRRRLWQVDCIANSGGTAATASGSKDPRDLAHHLKGMDAARRVKWLCVVASSDLIQANALLDTYATRCKQATCLTPLLEVAFALATNPDVWGALLVRSSRCLPQGLQDRLLCRSPRERGGRVVPVLAGDASQVDAWTMVVLETGHVQLRGDHDSGLSSLSATSNLRRGALELWRRNSLDAADSYCVKDDHKDCVYLGTIDADGNQRWLTLCPSNSTPSLASKWESCIDKATPWRVELQEESTIQPLRDTTTLRLTVSAYALSDQDSDSSLSVRLERFVDAVWQSFSAQDSAHVAYQCAQLYTVLVLWWQHAHKTHFRIEDAQRVHEKRKQCIRVLCTQTVWKHTGIALRHAALAKQPLGEVSQLPEDLAIDPLLSPGSDISTSPAGPILLEGDVVYHSSTAEVVVAAAKHRIADAVNIIHALFAAMTARSNSNVFSYCPLFALVHSIVRQDRVLGRAVIAASCQVPETIRWLLLHGTDLPSANRERRFHVTAIASRNERQYRLAVHNVFLSDKLFPGFNVMAHSHFPHGGLSWWIHVADSGRIRLIHEENQRWSVGSRVMNDRKKVVLCSATTDTSNLLELWGSSSNPGHFWFQLRDSDVDNDKAWVTVDFERRRDDTETYGDSYYVSAWRQTVADVVINDAATWTITCVPSSITQKSPDQFVWEREVAELPAAALVDAGIDTVFECVRRRGIIVRLLWHAATSVHLTLAAANHQDVISTWWLLLRALIRRLGTTRLGAQLLANVLLDVAAHHPSNFVLLVRNAEAVGHELCSILRRQRASQCDSGLRPTAEVQIVVDAFVAAIEKHPDYQPTLVKWCQFTNDLALLDPRFVHLLMRYGAISDAKHTSGQQYHHLGLARISAFYKAAEGAHRDSRFVIGLMLCSQALEDVKAVESHLLLSRTASPDRTACRRSARRVRRRLQRLQAHCYRDLALYRCEVHTLQRSEDKLPTQNDVADALERVGSRDDALQLLLREMESVDQMQQTKAFAVDESPLGSEEAYYALQSQGVGEERSWPRRFAIPFSLVMLPFLVAMRFLGIQVVFSFVWSNIRLVLCYTMGSLYYARQYPWRNTAEESRRRQSLIVERLGAACSAATHRLVRLRKSLQSSGPWELARHQAHLEFQGPTVVDLASGTSRQPWVGVLERYPFALQLIYAAMEQLRQYQSNRSRWTKLREKICGLVAGKIVGVSRDAVNDQTKVVVGVIRNELGVSCRFGIVNGRTRQVQWISALPNDERRSKTYLPVILCVSTSRHNSHYSVLVDAWHTHQDAGDHAQRLMQALSLQNWLAKGLVQLVLREMRRQKCVSATETNDGEGDTVDNHALLDPRRIMERVHAMPSIQSLTETFLFQIVGQSNGSSTELPEAVLTLAALSELDHTSQRDDTTPGHSAYSGMLDSDDGADEILRPTNDSMGMISIIQTEIINAYRFVHETIERQEDQIAAALEGVQCDLEALDAWNQLMNTLYLALRRARAQPKLLRLQDQLTQGRVTVDALFECLPNAFNILEADDVTAVRDLLQSYPMECNDMLTNALNPLKRTEPFEVDADRHNSTMLLRSRSSNTAAELIGIVSRFPVPCHIIVRSKNLYINESLPKTLFQGKILEVHCDYIEFTRDEAQQPLVIDLSGQNGADGVSHTHESAGTLPPGANGEARRGAPGAAGGNGAVGRDGGALLVYCQDEIVGVEHVRTINVSGGEGGAGGDGGAGGAGADHDNGFDGNPPTMKINPWTAGRSWVYEANRPEAMSKDGVVKGMASDYGRVWYAFEPGTKGGYGGDGGSGGDAGLAACGGHAGRVLIFVKTRKYDVSGITQIECEDLSDRYTKSDGTVGKGGKGGTGGHDGLDKLKKQVYVLKDTPEVQAGRITITKWEKPPSQSLPQPIPDVTSFTPSDQAAQRQQRTKGTAADGKTARTSRARTRTSMNESVTVAVATFRQVIAQGATEESQASAISPPSQVEVELKARQLTLSRQARDLEQQRAWVSKNLEHVRSIVATQAQTVAIAQQQVVARFEERDSGDAVGQLVSPFYDDDDRDGDALALEISCVQPREDTEFREFPISLCSVVPHPCHKPFVPHALETLMARVNTMRGVHLQPLLELLQVFVRLFTTQPRALQPLRNRCDDRLHLLLCCLHHNLSRFRCLDHLLGSSYWTIDVVRQLQQRTREGLIVDTAFQVAMSTPGLVSERHHEAVRAISQSLEHIVALRLAIDRIRDAVNAVVTERLRYELVQSPSVDSNVTDNTSLPLRRRRRQQRRTRRRWHRTSTKHDATDGIEDGGLDARVRGMVKTTSESVEQLLSLVREPDLQLCLAEDIAKAISSSTSEWSQLRSRKTSTVAPGTVDAMLHALHTAIVTCVECEISSLVKPRRDSKPEALKAIPRGALSVRQRYVLLQCQGRILELYEDYVAPVSATTAPKGALCAVHICLEAVSAALRENDTKLEDSAAAIAAWVAPLLSQLKLELTAYGNELPSSRFEVAFPVQLRMKDWHPVHQLVYAVSTATSVDDIRVLEHDVQRLLRTMWCSPATTERFAWATRMWRLFQSRVRAVGKPLYLSALDAEVGLLRESLVKHGVEDEQCAPLLTEFTANRDAHANAMLDRLDQFVLVHVRSLSEPSSLDALKSTDRGIYVSLVDLYEALIQRVREMNMRARLSIKKKSLGDVIEEQIKKPLREMPLRVLVGSIRSGGLRVDENASNIADHVCERTTALLEENTTMPPMGDMLLLTEVVYVVSRAQLHRRQAVDGENKQKDVAWDICRVVAARAETLTRAASRIGSTKSDVWLARAVEGLARQLVQDITSFRHVSVAQNERQIVEAVQELQRLEALLSRVDGGGASISDNNGDLTVARDVDPLLHEYLSRLASWSFSGLQTHAEYDALYAFVKSHSLAELYVELERLVTTSLWRLQVPLEDHGIVLGIVKKWSSVPPQMSLSFVTTMLDALLKTSRSSALSAQHACYSRLQGEAVRLLEAAPPLSHGDAGKEELQEHLRVLIRPLAAASGDLSSFQRQCRGAFVTAASTYAARSEQTAWKREEKLVTEVRKEATAFRDSLSQLLILKDGARLVAFVMEHLVKLEAAHAIDQRWDELRDELTALQAHVTKLVRTLHSVEGVQALVDTLRQRLYASLIRSKSLNIVGSACTSETWASHVERVQSTLSTQLQAALADANEADGADAEQEEKEDEPTNSGERVDWAASARFLVLAPRVLRPPYDPELQKASSQQQRAPITLSEEVKTEVTMAGHLLQTVVAATHSNDASTLRTLAQAELDAAMAMVMRRWHDSCAAIYQQVDAISPVRVLESLSVGDPMTEKERKAWETWLLTMQSAIKKIEALSLSQVPSQPTNATAASQEVVDRVPSLLTRMEHDINELTTILAESTLPQSFVARIVPLEEIARVHDTWKKIWTVEGDGNDLALSDGQRTGVTKQLARLHTEFDRLLTRDERKNVNIDFPELQTPSRSDEAVPPSSNARCAPLLGDVCEFLLELEVDRLMGHELVRVSRLLHRDETSFTPHDIGRLAIVRDKFEAVYGLAKLVLVLQAVVDAVDRQQRRVRLLTGDSYGRVDEDQVDGMVQSQGEYDIISLPVLVSCALESAILLGDPSAVLDVLRSFPVELVQIRLFQRCAQIQLELPVPQPSTAALSQDQADFKSSLLDRWRGCQDRQQKKLNEVHNALDAIAFSDALPSLKERAQVLTVAVLMLQTQLTSDDQNDGEGGNLPDRLDESALLLTQLSSHGVLHVIHRPGSVLETDPSATEGRSCLVDVLGTCLEASDLLRCERLVEMLVTANALQLVRVVEDGSVAPLAMREQRVVHQFADLIQVQGRAAMGQLLQAAQDSRARLEEAVVEQWLLGLHQLLTYLLDENKPVDDVVELLLRQDDSCSPLTWVATLRHAEAQRLAQSLDLGDYISLMRREISGANATLRELLLPLQGGVCCLETEIRTIFGIYDLHETDKGAGSPWQEWLSLRAKDGIDLTSTATAQAGVALVMRGCQIARGIKLRETQVLALWLFVHPRVIEQHGLVQQIATGEGKTLIVACLAVLKALSGIFVDVITNSRVYAERDATAMAQLFYVFGLLCSNNCDDECESGIVSSSAASTATPMTPEEVRRARYWNASRGEPVHVVYGDVASFQRDELLTLQAQSGDVVDEGPIIHERRQKKEVKRSLRPSHAVIVDEIDSLALDKATDVLYLAHPISALSGLFPTLVKIWETVNEPQFAAITFSCTDDQLRELVHAIADALAVELRQDPTTSVSEYTIARAPYAMLTHFVQRRLRVWVENAFRAKRLQSDKDFVVVQGSGKTGAHATIMDRDNGTELQATQWTQGLHQFLQLVETEPVTPETLKALFLSNQAFVRSYGAQVFGLTGTLGCDVERCMLESTYGVRCCAIPRFKLPRFTFERALVLTTRKSWLQATCAAAIRVATDARTPETGEKHRARRPRAVLAICDSVMDARAVHETLLKTHPLSQCHLYVSSFSTPVTAVGAGDVIVSTNLAGRGMDITPSGQVLAHGGLHVIVAVMPHNARVEWQALGRTARKGDPGTAQFIVHDPLGRTIAQLQRDRNGIESVRLRRVVDQDMKRIQVEELLLRGESGKETRLKEGYLAFELRLRRRQVQLGARDIVLDAAMSALRNRWAFWLDDMEPVIEHVTIVGLDAILTQFQCFKDSVEQDIEQHGLSRGLLQEPSELMRLGVAYLEQSEWSQARECLERVVELDASSTQPQFGIAHLYIGIATLNETEDSNEGRRTFRKQLKLAQRAVERMTMRLQQCKLRLAQVKLGRQAIGHSERDHGLDQQVQEHMGLWLVFSSVIQQSIGESVSAKDLKGHEAVVNDTQAKQLLEALVQKDVVTKIQVRQSVEIKAEKTNTAGANDLQLIQQKKLVPVRLPAPFDGEKEQQFVLGHLRDRIEHHWRAVDLQAFQDKLVADMGPTAFVTRAEVVKTLLEGGFLRVVSSETTEQVGMSEEKPDSDDEEDSKPTTLARIVEIVVEKVIKTPSKGCSSSATTAFLDALQSTGSSSPQEWANIFADTVKQSPSLVSMLARLMPAVIDSTKITSIPALKLHEVFKAVPEDELPFHETRDAYFQELYQELFAIDVLKSMKVNMRHGSSDDSDRLNPEQVKERLESWRQTLLRDVLLSETFDFQGNEAELKTAVEAVFTTLDACVPELDRLDSTKAIAHLTRIIDKFYVDAGKAPPDSLREFMTLSLEFVFTLVRKKDPPCWWSIAGVILGGLAQMAAGLLCKYCLPGVGLVLGEFLLSTGFDDVVFGVECSIKREFSAQAYWEHKKSSMTIAAISAVAMGAASFASNAVKLKSAGKAFKVMKQTQIHTLKAVGKSGAAALTKKQFLKMAVREGVVALVKNTAIDLVGRGLDTVVNDVVEAHRDEVAGMVHEGIERRWRDDVEPVLRDLQSRSSNQQEYRDHVRVIQTTLADVLKGMPVDPELSRTITQFAKPALNCVAAGMRQGGGKTRLAGALLKSAPTCAEFGISVAQIALIVTRWIQNLATRLAGLRSRLGKKRRTRTSAQGPTADSGTDGEDSNTRLEALSTALRKQFESSASEVILNVLAKDIVAPLVRRGACSLVNKAADALMYSKENRELMKRSEDVELVYTMANVGTSGDPEMDASIRDMAEADLQARRAEAAAKRSIQGAERVPLETMGDNDPELQHIFPENSGSGLSMAHILQQERTRGGVKLYRTKDGKYYIKRPSLRRIKDGVRNGSAAGAIELQAMASARNVRICVRDPDTGDVLSVYDPDPSTAGGGSAEVVELGYVAPGEGTTVGHYFRLESTTEGDANLKTPFTNDCAYVAVLGGEANRESIKQFRCEVAARITRDQDLVRTAYCLSDPTFFTMYQRTLGGVRARRTAGATRRQPTTPYTRQPQPNSTEADGENGEEADDDDSLQEKLDALVASMDGSMAPYPSVIEQALPSKLSRAKERRLLEEFLDRSNLTDAEKQAIRTMHSQYGLQVLVDVHGLSKLPKNPKNHEMGGLDVSDIQEEADATAHDESEYLSTWAQLSAVAQTASDDDTDYQGGSVSENSEPLETVYDNDAFRAMLRAERKNSPGEDHYNFYQLLRTIDTGSWMHLSDAQRANVFAIMQENVTSRPEESTVLRIRYPSAEKAADFHGQDKSVYDQVNSCHTFPAKVIGSILLQSAIVSGSREVVSPDDELALRSFFSNFTTSDADATRWFDTFQAMRSRDATQEDAVRSFAVLRGQVGNGMLNMRMGDKTINTEIGGYPDLPYVHPQRRYMTRSFQLQTSSELAAKQLQAVDGLVKRGLVNGPTLKNWMTACAQRSSSIAESGTGNRLHSENRFVQMSATGATDPSVSLYTSVMQSLMRRHFRRNQNGE